MQLLSSLLLLASCPAGGADVDTVEGMEMEMENGMEVENWAELEEFPENIRKSWTERMAGGRRGELITRARKLRESGDYAEALEAARADVATRHAAEDKPAESKAFNMATIKSGLRGLSSKMASQVKEQTSKVVGLFKHKPDAPYRRAAKEEEASEASLDLNANATEATRARFFVGAGGEECPQGWAPIMDVQTCKTALQMFGVSPNNDRTDWEREWANKPAGCIMHTHARNVLFNRAPTGKRNEDDQIFCQRLIEKAVAGNGKKGKNKAKAKGAAQKGKAAMPATGGAKTAS